MYRTAHVIAVVHPLHVNLVGLAPSRRQGPSHYKPISAMLEARMPFDNYDALHAEMVLAAETLAVVDFFHPAMMLEFFMPEMLIFFMPEMLFVRPSMIFVPIPIFIVAIGMSVPMARVFLVLVGIAVTIVVVVLSKSGYTRRDT